MIQEITNTQFKQFWPTFEKIIQAQQTYAFDPNMSCEKAYNLWCIQPIKTFVYVENEQVLGTYYIKANAAGPSSHIANCGYMVSEAARGKGIARQLCEHSQKIAIDMGFKAMQFNSVVSTNDVAIQLWKKLGFKVIGTIPKAYKHKSLGFVDSLIMHKQLVAVG